MRNEPFFERRISTSRCGFRIIDNSRKKMLPRVLGDVRVILAYKRIVHILLSDPGTERRKRFLPHFPL